MKRRTPEQRAAAVIVQQRYFATPKGQAARRRMREKHGARLAREHRGRLRDLIQGLKNQPCADCGGTFDPVCMDFDHRPGEIKIANVSQLDAVAGGRAALLREIAKCDLVCANCHRIRTHRTRDGHAHASTHRPTTLTGQLALFIKDPT